MAKIQQLSSHVADLIAAGEVVERPASVVKELTENSIDAGSLHITVEIQNGGMTFLRVTDDGCGMEPEDAPTAFLRHATSKIRQAEDLETIHTLGFRGEALAATAAVSRIELLTRTGERELGVRLQLEGGALRSEEEAGCPAGTTILVRDLFFNTPARMKFMKRDSVEASHVLGVLQKQALAHPEISFRYIRDGQEELHTSGDGDLYSAIYQIFGRQFASELLPVEGAWEQYRLTGFVTKPTSSRGNRGYQNFYVNQRSVRSRLLSAALEDAYRNQLMTGRFPGCVLMLTLPESAVDVNVHPAKTEVKFLAEQTVFDCVHYVTTAALQKNPGKPELRLPKREPHEAAQSPQPPAEPAKVKAAAKPEFFRTMTAEDFRAFSQVMAEAPKTKAAPEIVRELDAHRPVPLIPPKEPEEASIREPLCMPKAPEPVPAEPPISFVPEIPDPPQEADYRMIGEALNTYILVEQNDTLYLIDKHAAHERILFEKIRKQQRVIMSQGLLAPHTLRLTPEEATICLENSKLLDQLGFGIEDFGGGDLLLRRIPADLTQEQSDILLSQLAGQLLEGFRLDRDILQEKLLHTVACKAAIKGGWHTDPRELEELVRQVLSRDDLKYCPHGRPITVTLTRQALEKQFGRQ